MSSTSSRYANSSKSLSSPRDKAQSTPRSTPPPTHSTPEQGETERSTFKDAAIRAAFLSESAATDFLSAYGRLSPLSLRVYNLGIALDELDAHRRHFLRTQAQVKLHYEELARHLPRGPALDDIRRKVVPFTSPIGHGVKIEGEQTPNRRPQNPERPTGPHPLTPSPANAGLSQPAPLDEPRRNRTTRSSAPDYRRIAPTRGWSDRPPPRRRGPCPLCGRVDHLKTQCHNFACPHCETYAPGHFPLFCTKNPYAGISRRDLPSVALDYIQTKERDFYSLPIPSRAPNATTIPGLPAHDHTSQHTLVRAKLTVDNLTKHTKDTATPPPSPPKTVHADGPVFKPVFLIPKKSSPKPTTKLQQFATTTPPTANPNMGRKPTPRSTRKEPPHHISTPTTTLNRTSGRTYEEDEYAELDDAAEYNISGEGNF